MVHNGIDYGIMAAYAEGLRSCNALQLPVEREWARSTFWMYGVVLRSGRVPAGLAAELGERLQARGVQTRPFFLGMHEQPALLRMGLFAGEKYPVTERLARAGLYLPSGTALTDEQVQEVVAAVLDSLE